MSLLNYVKKVSTPSLGEVLIKEGSSTFKPAGYSREFQAAENVGGGYTEKYEPAELDVTLQPHTTLSLEELGDLKNENITVELAGGSVYLMPNSWMVNQIELSKGELKATFQSSTSERIA